MNKNIFFLKKKSLHINYKEIKVKMTNGSIFVTKSTGKNKVLDVDTLNHPAWTKNNNNINFKNKKVIEFNKKFKGLNNILNSY